KPPPIAAPRKPPPIPPPPIAAPRKPPPIPPPPPIAAPRKPPPIPPPPPIAAPRKPPRCAKAPSGGKDDKSSAATLASQNCFIGRLLRASASLKTLSRAEIERDMNGSSSRDRSACEMLFLLYQGRRHVRADRPHLDSEQFRSAPRT